MSEGWLAELFDRERPRLRAVAYRLLGSADDADDAVQEAWLRLDRMESNELDNVSGWLTTVVARIALDLLRKRGVKAIEVVGADFDPRFHQAVVHEVSPDHREGEVMQELRRGYMLGDRLLRPAMVKVAKA